MTESVLTGQGSWAGSAETGVNGGLLMTESVLTGQLGRFCRNWCKRWTAHDGERSDRAVGQVLQKLV